MGAGFYYLILFVIFMAFAVCWIISLVLFRAGRRKKRPVVKWIGLVGLVPLTLMGIAIASLNGYGYVRTVVPSWVYADALGEKPSDDVSDIKGKYVRGYEREYVHLQFHADRSTFERICRAEAKTVTYEEFVKQIPNPIVTPPSWWTSLNSEVTIIRLHVAGNDIHWSHDVMYVTYNESNRKVQYFWFGY